MPFFSSLRLTGREIYFGGQSKIQQCQSFQIDKKKITGGQDRQNMGP